MSGPAPHLHGRQRRRRQEHADRTAAVRLAGRSTRIRCSRSQTASRNRTAGPIDFSLFTDGLQRRARAGHHHRRRLPLLRDRAAQVHPRRHAGPRAVHAQHGDRRVDRRRRHPARRRPARRAGADAAARAHRAPARHLRASSWPSTRWTWSTSIAASSTPSATTSPDLAGDATVHADSDERAARRQRHRRERPHALVRRAEPARVSRDGRRRRASTRPRRSACRCSSSLRPDQDFRGYAGQIASGTIRAGDTRHRLAVGLDEHGRPHRHLGRRSRRRARADVGHARRSRTSSTSAAATCSRSAPIQVGTGGSRPTSSGWTNGRSIRGASIC